MIKHKLKFLQIFMLGLTIISTFSACKKDSDNSDSDYKVFKDIRDSAYLYTQDIYLWYDKLPEIEVFKPRNSANIFEVMDRVKTYQSLDKWSFAETQEETNQSQQGLDTDFGFLVKFIPGSATEIRVNYVYANSKAGLAGVQRSWRINKINGRIINRSVQADIDYINDIFFGTPQSAAFEFIKPDNTTVTVTLQKSTYTINTVLYSNIYTRGTRKIGYFVFNEFSGATSVTELVNTINNFQNQGVNEVVVDLRYNRGGFVSTQDTLANMLAPKSVGRGLKTMYTYVFNDKYSSWNESNKFYKTGNLDLSRIVFIVSPSSASASELLINNLNPVMDVILIGDTRTYGKPVGFFPIPVYNYNIFPVSFKTVNSAGKADYFEGFPVVTNIADDLYHDFGDTQEANLKEALRLIAPNNVSASVSSIRPPVSQAEIQRAAEINYNFAEHVPSAAIENRPSRMPSSIRRVQK